MGAGAAGSDSILIQHKQERYGAQLGRRDHRLRINEALLFRPCLDEKWKGNLLSRGGSVRFESRALGQKHVKMHLVLAKVETRKRARQAGQGPMLKSQVGSRESRFCWSCRKHLGVRSKRSVLGEQCIHKTSSAHWGQRPTARRVFSAWRVPGINWPLPCVSDVCNFRGVLHNAEGDKPLRSGCEEPRVVRPLDLTSPVSQR